MITMYIRYGRAVKPDDCIHKGAYNPPMGTIIKFIAEDGNEYHIVTCDDSNGHCVGCVFNHACHPISNLFKGKCGQDITQLHCYDRVYKPIDTILEDL